MCILCVFYICVQAICNEKLFHIQSWMTLIRAGVKKNVFLGLCLKHRTPPTHRARLGQNPKKNVFFTIFGALKHNEMAKYDLPPYVLHVLGYFWMFAVKITEWIFSLKSLGLLTWTWTHLPIVWDKVPNKFGFFLTPSLNRLTCHQVNRFYILHFPNPIARRWWMVREGRCQSWIKKDPIALFRPRTPIHLNPDQYPSIQNHPYMHDFSLIHYPDKPIFNWPSSFSDKRLSGLLFHETFYL